MKIIDLSSYVEEGQQVTIDAISPFTNIRHENEVNMELLNSHAQTLQVTIDNKRCLVFNISIS